MAVFDGFKWDDSVKDKDGNVCEFKNINILYGRNYSGKTTLSRIFRALETNKLSDKYQNPSFSVLFEDGAEVTQLAPNAHSKCIRVFNEDFVRENLKFISDPDEGINSFAILGSDNNIIEAEIEALRNELGSNEDGNETALYASLREAQKQQGLAETNLRNTQRELDKQLSKKATDRQIGIKYNAGRFGDQNYTVAKLKADIEKVSSDAYEIISYEKQKELEALLDERANQNIPALTRKNLQFDTLSEQSKQLVEKEIAASNKIEELVKDAVLNRWVKEGRSLHKGQRRVCAFCDNPIQESRWSELDKHFDAESDQLEKDLNALVDLIRKELESIKADFNPNKSDYYSKFHTQIETLFRQYSSACDIYTSSLSELLEQLQNRLDNLINPFEFKQPASLENEINSIWDQLEAIRTESNEYTNSLSTEQTKAKAALRLQEVYEFIDTIQYEEQLEAINRLSILKGEADHLLDVIKVSIKQKEQLIGDKKALLQDESKGAEKVNEYLNNFFGHNFLSLEAVEFQEDGNFDKQFRFEVTRNGEKAFHLSEGECSLVAFCYFMGKLSDIETKGEKPIIWIDDPISSLDGNHVFFIYSLIKAEIVKANLFEQLFISTHSLDFLKYLKRLSRGEGVQCRYFIILRNEQQSSVLLMPKYLREYITEFNYLFHHIFNCSNLDAVDDSNHDQFYNFGNNARKFLEMYLYYKFPDDSNDYDKMVRFFGGETIPAILTDRINNEMSHLSGGMERGAEPIEVPEMKLAAQLILERIKVADIEQYKSLLKSIGEEFVEGNHDRESHE